MWQTHCTKNTLMTMLPWQHQLRRFKRRVFGLAQRIDERSVYAGGFDQIALLRDAGLTMQGLDILEIGSGWFPVIPLMMRIAGARTIILTDEHALLDLQTLDITVAFLLERKADLAQRLNISVAEIEDKLRIPQGNLDDALAAMGITYAVPFDYQRADVQVDVIISHTVLEHISPQLIVELMRDVRRVLRPNGLILHGIDHSDHRANVDSRLSRIDFLRYSDRVWRMLCIHPQDYTNRLRHSDYVAMFKAGGFEIVSEDAHPDPTCRAANVPLAARFWKMDRDDVATLWSIIVMRRKLRSHREMA